MAFTRPVAPSSAISPEAIANFTKLLDALVRGQRACAVATLSAAVVEKMNRKVSIAEVLEIHTDIRWALFPEAQEGGFQELAQTKQERLDQIRS